MFEEILATHHIKMTLDLGIFLGETVDFFLGEAAT
jgi:hypothetical protein